MWKLWRSVHRLNNFINLINFTNFQLLFLTRTRFYVILSVLWKEHTNQIKEEEQKNTDLSPVCFLMAEELFFPAAAQKAESACRLN